MLLPLRPEAVVLYLVPLTKGIPPRGDAPAPHERLTRDGGVGGRARLEARVADGFVQIPYVLTCVRGLRSGVYVCVFCVGVAPRADPLYVYFPPPPGGVECGECTCTIPCTCTVQCTCAVRRERHAGGGAGVSRV